MAYATLDDLETRFGRDELAERTDRAGGDVIDAAVVARALDDASTQIDLYLAGRYAVPVTPPPAQLVQLACDIARYRLWQPAPSEGVRQGYEDAIRTLRDLAEGRAVLAGAAAPATPAAGGPVRIDSPGRVFARDQLQDYTA
jgi:phage gp36-like protein